MKAIVQYQYGSPEVLHLEQVTKPLPQANEVLVRVQAAAVNAGDWHLIRGTPFFIRLMFGGLFKPTIAIPGMDMAGQVEAVGENVTQFKPGDGVFGELSEWGFGAFAEYVCVPEAALAPQPTNLTFEQAAAVPGAALAALQALRDCGQLQAGQRVLVKGASGGVGSFAVQIAKAWDAEVTGVCSTAKVAMVRELGADHIIDYCQMELTQQREQYELMIDAAAYWSVSDYLPLLKPEGTYVMVGGSTTQFFQALLFGSWLSKRSGRNVECLTTKPNSADLDLIRELLEAGKIKPYIDRTYPLNEVPAAIRRLEERQVQGKVVIRV
ncbi:MAG: NAD(P)-dependent alcohol dehydrogenase [Spirulina sp. SIO3F2]|nr:NAD(P)-dependent alcohol dehydrogenase [Spirulina sp. SIO3F2]